MAGPGPRGAISVPEIVLPNENDALRILDNRGVLIAQSAKLVCDITKRNNIPRDKYHIVGHGQLQPYNRTDPGPNWPWAAYLDSVRSYCGDTGGGGRHLRRRAGGTEHGRVRLHVEGVVDGALLDLAVLRVQNARHRLEHAGLAGAVGSQQRDDPAGRHLQRHVAHGLDHCLGICKEVIFQLR